MSPATIGVRFRARKPRPVMTTDERVVVGREIQPVTAPGGEADVSMVKRRA